MKFRVERDVLADAVAWAARSLPVRPSVPVLAGLLIEANDDGLVLSTFDYETSARATLNAQVSDTRAPSSTMSTGLAGRLRQMSASSRPLTRARPSSLTWALSVARAEVS